MVSKFRNRDSSRLYSVIWRWHFYCGLVFSPIVILLAITGSIYLFQNEYEAWRYRPVLNISPGEQRLSVSEQIAAAQGFLPGKAPVHYVLPRDEKHSAQIAMKEEAGEKVMLVFVNPYTGTVLGELEKDGKLMAVIRDLHGNLLAGEFGTKFVELTACWTLMLMVTGVYLWWPRSRFSVWGTLLPRLRSGRRLFWRDLHSVFAFHFAFLIIFLLLSGLPWSDVWGGSLKAIQKATHQDAPPGRSPHAFKSVYSENSQPVPVDQIARFVRDLKLEGEIRIGLPVKKDDVYHVVSSADDPAKQVYLHIDQYSGKVVNESRWKDHPLVAKAVALGIKLHQGDYFGLADQLIALATALVLVFMSVSGMIMWWQRRPGHKLGAPKRHKQFSSPRWIIGMTLLFCVFLPLLGASLLLFILLDRLAVAVLIGKRRQVA